MEVNEFFEFLRNSKESEEMPNFIELIDKREEVIFNTMMYLNMMSLQNMLEILFVFERPKNESIEIALFLNKYYNEFLPELIRQYKEKEHERKQKQS